MNADSHVQVDLECKRVTQCRMEVTREEAFQIMEQKLGNSNFEIASFDLEMLGEWLGLCADHAILKIRLQEPENPETFFVKLYPRIPSIADFIEWTGAFRKEIFVYNYFDQVYKEGIKILADCVRRCYLTVPKKFLVLENLFDESFTSTDKFQVFDYDTTKVVLEALAKLHSSTLIYEEKKSLRLIDNYEQELEETHFNDRADFRNKPALEATITGVLNCIQLFNFPEKLLSGKNFRTVLEQVCKKVYELAKPSKTFRNVLCHGDMWATNVLIKRESGKPVKCKLVDFQCGRYSPPAQDVMSVIYLTTSREFRKKYMYTLIGVYYTNLEKHIALAGYDMKKIIPFGEFLASCEEQKAFGLVQTATYFPLILLDSQQLKEFYDNGELSKEALYVDRSILVKDQMGKNEEYKKRIRDCIQDLKDYCDYL